MPSRLSVPRIRVDLADSPPYDLPSSGTLDIKDVLGRAKLLPRLLAECLVFDGADDALDFEDGCSQNFPSFPAQRQPPLFILDSYRARLPFPLRSDAFGMCDFFAEEGNPCPLLTIPTIPRMRRMMQEQLYVQKWVDTLTPDNPPRHIPWACEKPATKRKWVAEGSIFPTDVIKTGKFSTEGRGAIQECPYDTNWLSTLANPAPCSRESCTLSASPLHSTAESHALTPEIQTNSADDDLGIFRWESRTSQAHHCRARTSHGPSPPILFPSVPPTGETVSTLHAPLAARRGKTLSALKLRRGVIERLEYPDIPTAFRGSSMVWSPQFDTFIPPYFTDHESMLFNLQSKCATLGSGVSTFLQESWPPNIGLIRTSPSVDEWAFTRGLATFDNSLWGSTERQVPREITADMSIFLPDAPSTLVKGPGFTAHPEFVSRPHSTLALQSPGNRSSDPPGVPLPPRPALVNPLTPPHVRGILKKAKNVRFEDISTHGSENQTSPVVLPLKASPGPLLPSVLVASSVRSYTPMLNTTIGPGPVGEVLRKNTQTKCSPRPRPPTKRSKTSGELVPTPPSNIGLPKLPTATTAVERPCRIAYARENADPTIVPLAQAKSKGATVTEIEVRKRIEGTAKSRLSTPLRNIFRFR